MSDVGPFEALVRDRKIIATMGLGVAGIGLTWNMETWRKHLASTNRRGMDAVRVLRSRGDFDKLLRATFTRGARWGLVGCLLGAVMRPFIFPLVGARQRRQDE